MPPSPRPNVLLIYTDQWRFDALGCAGNPDVQTPHLDALARRGVRFDRHFVQNPVCMPSRVSMLSGRYPSNLGILRMGVPVPEDVVCVQHLMRRAGYRTANLGKLHFLPHANRDHRDPHPTYGFDHLELSDEPGPYEDAYRAFVRRHFPEHLDASSAHAFPPMAKTYRDATGFDDGVKHPDDHPDRTWVTTAFGGPDDATYSAFVGRRTIELLDRHAASRDNFFCVASFYSPHSPLVAPQKFLDLYDPASFTLPEFPEEFQEKRVADGFDDDTIRQAMHGYYAMTSEVDHWVGQIIAKLDATGLADDTVVAFTSDHGEFLGEHARWGKFYPGPECVARVPLIVAGPGVRPGTCDAIVEAVDLTPTLLELAGIPQPVFMDGDSLGPALRGEAFAGKPGALMEDAMPGFGWRAWRTDTHRYLLHDDGREMLFDLSAAFSEYRDVSGRPEHADALLAHRHGLATRLVRVAENRAPIWPY
ncbi:MAG: sulfatase-like hydrolase/transferase [Planctomycetota bacterium]